MGGRHEPVAWGHAASNWSCTPCMIGVGTGRRRAVGGTAHWELLATTQQRLNINHQEIIPPAYNPGVCVLHFLRDMSATSMASSKLDSEFNEALLDVRITWQPRSFVSAVRTVTSRRLRAYAPARFTQSGSRGSMVPATTFALSFLRLSRLVACGGPTAQLPTPPTASALPTLRTRSGPSRPKPAKHDLSGFHGVLGNGGT